MGDFCNGPSIIEDINYYAKKIYVFPSVCPINYNALLKKHTYIFYPLIFHDTCILLFIDVKFKKFPRRMCRFGYLSIVTHRFIYSSILT